MLIHVKIAKDTKAIEVASNATLANVASTIIDTFGGDLSLSSLTVLWKGRAFKPGHSTRHADTILHDAGIREGATLMVLANSSQAVQQAVDSSADDPLLRGIEEELALTARRRRTVQRPRLVTCKYTFQKYFALPETSLDGAHPPPQKALDLLHRLAADPGIVGIMQQHEFTVGCLSEMPPTDYMDDTRAVTCLLGLNHNRGQEIKLRLRTNDLKGFRNYEKIRETLVHELTHNVWGDHDNNFKELNSRLLRECVRINRVRASTQTLLGDSEVRDAEEMSLDSDARPTVHVLGGHKQPAASAAQAAAQAAAQRQSTVQSQQATASASAASPASVVDDTGDVTRDYEGTVDEQTKAEEMALAAWGDTGAGSTLPPPDARHHSAASEGAVMERDTRMSPRASEARAEMLPSEVAELAAPTSPEGPGGVIMVDSEAQMHASDDCATMPLEAVQGMVQSIVQSMRTQHRGDTGAMLALQTVLRILRNASEKREAKYRCIRRQNQLFATRVAPFPEAEALLPVAGFQLADDVWTLPVQASPRTLVRVHEEVQQMIQSCQ